MLKFHNRFPRTWWILSNIALDMGFTEVIGLAVISYSISIRDFMNSWPINFFLWSYMISIGLEYPDIHVASNKFAIYIALLSLYCAISNHPVTISITVTYFRCNFLSYPLFVWHIVLLDPHRVYYMVFTRLTYLVIYHIFIW